MKALHAILFVLLLTLPFSAHSEERSRFISVKGQETLTSPAEFATIHGQLKVTSDTPQESYDEVTRQLVELTDILGSLGLTKDDIIASMITQKIEYDWRNNKRVVKGHSAGCSLQIKVDEIAETYKIHNKLAAYRTLTIHHTTYGRNDESSMQIEALKGALKSARAKAVSMAETMSAKLGPVLRIQEGVGYAVPVGRPEMAMQAARAASPAEVTTTGTVTVTAHVIVDFELN